MAGFVQLLVVVLLAQASRLATRACRAPEGSQWWASCTALLARRAAEAALSGGLGLGPARARQVLIIARYVSSCFGTFTMSCRVRQQKQVFKNGSRAFLCFFEASQGPYLAELMRGSCLLCCEFGMHTSLNCIMCFASACALCGSCLLCLNLACALNCVMCFASPMPVRFFKCAAPQISNHQIASPVPMIL